MTMTGQEARNEGGILDITYQEISFRGTDVNANGVVSDAIVHKR